MSRDSRPVMKLAIPHWQGRVSPVFDVAANLLLIDVQRGELSGRQEIAVPAADPVMRAQQLARLGIQVVICGAVSWPAQSGLLSSGIDVIPQICGDIEEVIAAFIKGNLESPVFRMPGCCGRRQRSRRRGNCGGRGARRRGRSAMDAPPQSPCRRHQDRERP